MPGFGKMRKHEGFANACKYSIKDGSDIKEKRDIVKRSLAGPAAGAAFLQTKFDFRQIDNERKKR